MPTCIGAAPLSGTAASCTLRSSLERGGSLSTSLGDACLLVRRPGLGDCTAGGGVRLAPPLEPDGDVAAVAHARCGGALVCARRRELLVYRCRARRPAALVSHAAVGHEVRAVDAAGTEGSGAGWLVALGGAAGVELRTVPADAAAPPRWHLAGVAVAEVRFAPPGGGGVLVLAAATLDGRLALLRADGGSGEPRTPVIPIAVCGGARPTSVAWRPDGAALAVGAWDGAITVLRRAADRGLAVSAAWTLPATCVGTAALSGTHLVWRGGAGGGADVAAVRAGACSVHFYDSARGPPEADTTGAGSAVVRLDVDVDDDGSDDADGDTLKQEQDFDAPTAVHGLCAVDDGASLLAIDSRGYLHHVEWPAASAPLLPPPSPPPPPAPTPSAPSTVRLLDGDAWIEVGGGSDPQSAAVRIRWPDGLTEARNAPRELAAVRAAAAPAPAAYFPHARARPLGDEDGCRASVGSDHAAVRMPLEGGGGGGGGVLVYSREREAWRRAFGGPASRTVAAACVVDGAGDGDGASLVALFADGALRVISLRGWREVPLASAATAGASTLRALRTAATSGAATLVGGRRCFAVLWPGGDRGAGAAPRTDAVLGTVAAGVSLAGPHSMSFAGGPLTCRAVAVGGDAASGAALLFEEAAGGAWWHGDAARNWWRAVDAPGGSLSGALEVWEVGAP